MLQNVIIRFFLVLNSKPINIFQLNKNRVLVSPGHYCDMNRVNRCSTVNFVIGIFCLTQIWR